MKFYIPIILFAISLILTLSHCASFYQSKHLVYSTRSSAFYRVPKDEIKSKPFLYTTMPAIQEIYEQLKCETFSNVIVHYDKQKVKDYSTGQFLSGPDPFGISGCGLWFTPPQVKAKGEHIDKKLVAIMTEWPKENRKFWIGTRIDVITEVIRQKYDLTIEASKVVRVNL